MREQTPTPLHGGLQYARALMRGALDVAAPAHVPVIESHIRDVERASAALEAHDALVAALRERDELLRKAFRMLRDWQCIDPACPNCDDAANICMGIEDLALVDPGGSPTEAIAHD